MHFSLMTTVLAGSLMLFGPAPVSAEVDFTFKRVKPPVPGTKKRITIQVEPVPEVKPVLANIPDVPTVEPENSGDPRPGPVPGNASETATWFWTQMSPNLVDAGYGKLARAVEVLGRNDAKAAAVMPSPGRIAKIAQQYGAQILVATAGTQVSPALVLSVISVESAGQVSAKSSAGAVGLMQLMPATAQRFGVSDRTDPNQNITGGVQYLDFLLTEFQGDALLALAAYNAGEGAVTRAGGVPDYRETRAYVPKVVAAWTQARMLCLSPPTKATDGCLFTGVRVAQQ